MAGLVVVRHSRCGTGGRHPPPSSSGAVALPSKPSQPAAPTFEIAALDFDLPEDLIAQQPAPARDGARLLTLDRTTGAIGDRAITDLPELLAPGDLLILNDTRVIPARFHARRDTGGLVEGLFVESPAPGLWRVMLKGSRRLRPGETLSLQPGPAKAARTARLHLSERLEDGHWNVQVSPPGTPEEILAECGETPLPPYIRRSADDPADRERYQTVYAKTPGAVAAPTAGLHLTESLLNRLHDRGIATAFVTLHVGLGTFKPIAAERIEQHTMHEERFVLPPETAAAIADCRRRAGRVVAVGTTSVRVLESAAAPGDSRLAEPRSGATSIFIHPPYNFRVVDVLLTNFHLPRSTLLALVMAFAGEARVRQAYAHAVANRYRFFSYGDAMLAH